MMKKDWMTGLAIYGELTGGYVFKASIGHAKRSFRFLSTIIYHCVLIAFYIVCVSLLKDDNVVLPALGKAIPFELAVGYNGIIWVNSKSCHDTILITNAILNAECLSLSQSEAMVHRLIQEHGVEH